MGGSNTKDAESETIAETQKIKKLTLSADNFSYRLQLNAYGTSIMRRIFVQKRQKHLIEVIQKMNSKQQIEDFLDQIHTANLQILDSFYEHIVKNSIRMNSERDEVEVRNQIISPLDRQIGICGATKIMECKNWDPISQKYVNIVDLAKGVAQMNEYEAYKQKGLDIIKKQQICFILLAGGKGVRYDLKQYKQCDPISQFPSKPSLIEIFLKKFEALGRLISTPIHVYIMVNDEERKKKIRKIRSHRIPNPQYLQVDYLQQINYGCLDIDGKLVLTDQNQVYLHPNGSGDLWANFEPKNYENFRLNRFKYFQIFGVSNMLEHCFDCYMIGRLSTQQLPWITMATYDLLTQDQNPVIFVNHDKKLHVRDTQQIGSGMDTDNLSYFPKKCPHLFLNNSVFSAEFIQNAIKSPNWHSHRKYHCKLKKIDHRPPLSKYSQIFVFERELADIFAITEPALMTSQSKKDKKDTNGRGTVVLMSQTEYYSPFITKNDRITGAVALSNMYKNWLKIPLSSSQSLKDKDKDDYEEQLKQICQIDPYISLEGENLEETIQDIRKLEGNLEYPFFVGPEQGEEFRLTNNTNNFQEGKFTKLNELALDKF